MFPREESGPNPSHHVWHRSKANGQKRFNVALSSSVREVEGRLSLRRSEMDAAWADLDKQWSLLEQRMGSVGIIVKNPKGFTLLFA